MNWSTIGALHGACAVGLGAFGSHGLKKYTSDTTLHQTWSTASQYHLLHSIVLLVTPLIIPVSSNRSIRAAQLINVGMILFSGSLYTLVLTNERRLGAVTPIGGLALIGGWIALALRK